eukprot:CAMPEP_0177669906 /NCGR_PEP_ID=MMETSP0447-20121125/23760_1 /TAXON_ID=0 /ORGANISM="Stygamoeba regulata, Strain BSH-02190019" /LENGTH=71 /DNA_ID=CAMNT_0019176943 /DNA_START=14 /DNA_END=229 /DNA_ORIENTATION=-
MSAGTRNMAAMFEKAAEDSKKTQTNAKRPVTREWTPNAEAGGAHSSTGYRMQTEKKESNGPPPKRSLASLP